MKIKKLKNGDIEIDGENNMIINVEKRQAIYVFRNGIASDWLKCEGISNEQITFKRCQFIQNATP